MPAFVLLEMEHVTNYVAFHGVCVCVCRSAAGPLAIPYTPDKVVRHAEAGVHTYMRRENVTRVSLTDSIDEEIEDSDTHQRHALRAPTDISHLEVIAELEKQIQALQSVCACGR